MRARVTADGLNVRSIGSMEGQIVDQLGKGEFVVLDGPAIKGWQRIRIGRSGKYGWVYAKYIQKIGPDAKAEKDERRAMIIGSLAVAFFVLFILATVIWG